MMRINQYLQRAVPQSTFSVTMVTISCIILIAAFFIKGIDHGSDESRMQEVAMAMVGAQQQEQVKPAGLPDKLSGEPVVDTPVVPKPRYVPASMPVNGAPRHAKNHSSLIPTYVGTLTRTCDCCWAEEGDSPKEGSKVHVGQTLNVTSGLVEIAFSCGAKAVLEGPAILEIQSPKTSDLKVGRITADVPDDLEGFKIKTPTAIITSLPSDSKSASKSTMNASVAKDAKS
jgi:hypothetical protein